MAIKIENLSFSYPNNRKALDNISLNIRKGKKTALLGLNGSGKSTLLYHLNGTLLPQEGKVEVMGLDVNKKNLPEIRKKVGFLFDYPDYQLFSITSYKDIKFGLDNYNYKEENKDDLIKAVARDLKIENILEYPPHQLSLGQKKRVAIAGVIVLKPDLIICDEPFSGLDGFSLLDFKKILDGWILEGKTILFSTHDVNLTYEWADDVILLERGKVIESGTVEEVMTNSIVYEENSIVKPDLYKLFENMEFKPRNLLEAKKYLELIS